MKLGERVLVSVSFSYACHNIEYTSESTTGFGHCYIEATAIVNAAGRSDLIVLTALAAV